MSRTKILLCLITTILALSGCNGDRCIDADDFGFPRFTVSSRYDPKATPVELYGQDDNEVGAWRESGYYVNGKPLTIVVKNWRADRDANSPGELSAWCPWYGSDSDGQTLGSFQLRFPTCKWYSNQTCSTPPAITALATNPAQGTVESASDVKTPLEINSVSPAESSVQSSGKTIAIATTTSAQPVNAPCLMKKGVGLYALIAKPGADPNENLDTMSGPPKESFVVFHVGGKHSGYTLYDNVLPAGKIDDPIPTDGSSATLTQTITNQGGNSTGGSGSIGMMVNEVNNPFAGDLSDLQSMISVDNSNPDQPEEAGGIVYQYEGMQDAASFIGGKLYFKILDSHYDDNGGQYIVIIKSGVQSENPDPINFVTNLIATQLFGAPQQDAANTTYGGHVGVVCAIYTSVIQNPSYRLAVSATLTIYVILFALSFLIGVVQITHTELIIRVLKIIIVSILLHPDYGWSFFNDNLFVFFVDGMHYLIQQIKDASQVGPASGGVFSLLTSAQLMKKVLALLFTSWHGPIFIILYIIILVFFGLAVIKNLMLYASSMIMIGLIIIMGPIFICFMLFNVTKSLFETWLKQLIFYSMNAIILVAIMAFIGVQVERTVYANFGFKVCRSDFPNLGPLFQMLPPSVGDVAPQSLFSWWFPSPKTEADFSKNLALIPVPEDHVDSTGKFCPAYGCFENRYYDLPFLDPLKDSERIHNFFMGSFTQIAGLFYLLILVYLLNKMNDSAVQIAGTLANVSMNQMSVQHAALGAYTPVAEKLSALNQTYGTGKITRPVEAAIDRTKAIAIGGSIAAAGAVKEIFVGEDGKLGKIEKHLRSADAMAPDAHQSVIDKVRLEYGIDRSKLNVNAQKDYNTRLAEHLPEKDARNLTHPFALREALTKKLYPNKTFDKLSDAERAAITKLMNDKGPDGKGKSLKDLAIDAHQVREFTDAYNKVYANISRQELGSRTSSDAQKHEQEHSVLMQKQKTARVESWYAEALTDKADKDAVAKAEAKIGVKLSAVGEAQSKCNALIQRDLEDAKSTRDKAQKAFEVADETFRLHKAQDAQSIAAGSLRVDLSIANDKRDRDNAEQVLQSASKKYDALNNSRNISDSSPDAQKAYQEYRELDQKFRDAYVQARGEIFNVTLQQQNAARIAAAARDEAFNRKVDAFKQKIDNATSGNWISDIADAGYGALFKVATGGQDMRDLPDMVSDPRHTTDREKQFEHQKSLDAKNVEDEIKRQRQIQNTDILHPEFLGGLDPNHPLAIQYHALAQKDIGQAVERLMKYGDRDIQGAILGETYTRKYMTDQEFAESLDRAKALGQQLIDDDQYIQQGYKYEDKNDPLSIGARKVIEDRRAMIEVEINKHIDLLESLRYKTDTTTQKGIIDEIEERARKDIGATRNLEGAMSEVSRISDVFRKDGLRQGVRQSAEALTKVGKEAMSIAKKVYERVRKNSQ